MTSLKVDPWDPQYGGSIDIDEDQEPDLDVIDLDVEDGEWEAREPAEPSALPRIAFIDGVRRIDVRLFAEEERSSAPAIAGSWAVGAAWSAKPPRIEPVEVGRELVVGGGLDHEDLVAHIGDHELRYQYSGVGDANLSAPMQGLQNRMREAEGSLGERVFEAGRADLMVLDGPLTYFAERGPVLGLIKRQSRAYLPPDRALILHTLAPGRRTPVFKIGEQHGREMYTWYARLADGRAIDGLMTGVVRVEVSTQVGLRQAVELADLSAAVLPRFATRIGRDPRAPQNLYPVAQLESTLRHRLGDNELVRRALETALWRRAHA